MRIILLFLPLTFILPARMSPPIVAPADPDVLLESTLRLVRCGVVVVKVRKPDVVKEIVGSGVIISNKHILTCCHVVRDAKTVHVVLIDTTVCLGKVVLEEPALDLAIVLIVTDQPLYVLRPSTARVEPGMTVFVVGHPFGYTYSISKGVVSAVGREIEMPSGDKLANMIQVDAPINPGNSGGPLLNKKGEWVGIVVALHKGAHGIAFVMPVESVRKTLVRFQNSM